jgi:hypothetical protein
MKALFLQFKTEAYVLLGLFLAWKLWPVISPLFSLASTVTETATKAAAGATANVQMSSQLAIDQAKLRVLYPGATEAQIAVLRSDARALASSLGQLSGKWGMALFFKDQQAAFTLLKQKYSRLYLVNNRPFDYNTKTSTSGETKNSAKRKLNYTVLQPFYDEYTGGNSLKADVQQWITGDVYKPYLKWIL